MKMLAVSVFIRLCDFDKPCMGRNEVLLRGSGKVLDASNEHLVLSAGLSGSMQACQQLGVPCAYGKVLWISLKIFSKVLASCAGIVFLQESRGETEVTTWRSRVDAQALFERRDRLVRPPLVRCLLAFLPKPIRLDYHVVRSCRPGGDANIKQTAAKQSMAQAHRTTSRVRL